MKKLALLGPIATIILAFALTSCGGSSSTPPNFVIPGNLQSYLSTPTYVEGTDELAAFMAINSFRHSMGLGYWQQNVYLDQAAKNHILYSMANGASFQQDSEVDGNVGYTGTTPAKRAIYTGYYVLANTPTASNEPTAAVGELYSLGTGAEVVNSMINTIYHRSGLMSQATRVMGLARDTTGAATPETHWWISHGRLDAGQQVASNYLSFYPLNQQTSVPLSMTPEYPSVYSNQANFNFATQTSSPVSFTSSAMTNLAVNSFTVTQAGSSTPLTGTVWTIFNDPNLSSLDFSKAMPSLSTPPAPVPTISPYEAYWVGDKPFLPNTTYNVTFTGSTYFINYALTNAVTSSWSFTTGST